MQDSCHGPVHDAQYIHAYIYICTQHLYRTYMNTEIYTNMYLCANKETNRYSINMCIWCMYVCVCASVYTSLWMFLCAYIIHTCIYHTMHIHRVLCHTNGVFNGNSGLVLAIPHVKKNVHVTNPRMLL